MNIIRNISLLIILQFFLFTAPLLAQSKEAFSYIYIQSDKDLPFYVKYEDEMLPRYGKSYSIISELAPGPANLQILFQQHTLPPIKFVVQVPEMGFRGFILTRKGDAFSLYDVHQKIYLPAGNQASDDKLPEFNYSQRIPEPVKAVVQPEKPKPAPVATIPVEKTKQPKPEKVKEKESEKPKQEIPVVKQQAPAPVPATTATPTPKPQPPAAKPIVTTPPPVPPTSNTNSQAPKKDPQFLDNIALENERTAAPGSTISKPARNRIVVMNSDCPEPISEDAFTDLESKLNDKFGDDRLKYLMGRMDNCYTTAQMRTLARAMSSDAERYTLLKRAYPRVTDQSVFHILEREFTEPEWKEYFRTLIKK